VPVFVKYALDGNIYSVQKVFGEWDENVPAKLKTNLVLFNLGSWKANCFVRYNNLPYRFDWESQNTRLGIYAFDCTYNQKDGKNIYSSIVNSLLYDARREKSPDVVVTTSELCARLKKNVWWQYEFERLLKNAKKNGYYKSETAVNPKPQKNAAVKQSVFSSWVQNVRLGTEEMSHSARLMIRMMATLEMFLKDPEADIAVRMGSKKDFAAALNLYEKITLPRYFGVVFEQPLFVDYESVEPFPSWEYWEQCGVAAW